MRIPTPHSLAGYVRKFNVVEAIAYSTVTNRVLAARIIPRDATALSDATSAHSVDSGEAILRSLEELMSSSVRQLSRRTSLPDTTVDMSFSKKLRFTEGRLRWVPHILSDHHRAQWVQCSRFLLTILLA
jgi:hypothetical protein